MKAARHLPPVAQERLRRCVRRAAGMLLRLRSRGYPLSRDRVAWVLAPHPDDDTFGCGGTILLKRLRGLRVRIVYLTDGGASHPGHPSLSVEALACRRREEAVAAASVLGADPADLRFLHAADGTLKDLAPNEADRLVDELAADLNATVPDEILLPGRADGSSEHEAAFRLVGRALRRLKTSPALLEFPVWAWWSPLRLVDPLLRGRRIWRVDYRGWESLKRHAIARHGTQLEAIPPWTEAPLPRAFAEAFVSGTEYLFEYARP